MFGSSYMIPPQGGPPWAYRDSWGKEKAHWIYSVYEASCRSWPIPTGLSNTRWYSPDYPVHQLSFARVPMITLVIITSHLLHIETRSYCPQEWNSCLVSANSYSSWRRSALNWACRLADGRIWPDTLVPSLSNYLLLD